MKAEEKQALIDDCEREIAHLKRCIKAYPNEPVLKRDLLRNEIALAALTAQPFAWLTDDAETDKSATTYSEQVAERWRNKQWPVTPLFIAPPAPVMQPVKLPQIIQIGYTHDEITAMCNVRNDAVAAIRAAGYPVEGD